MQDYELTWETHWKDICTNTDGSINVDQIKRELHDYSFMLEQVPEVYVAVTGGLLSKPHYFARSVIPVFEDHVNIVVSDNVKEIRESIEEIRKENEYVPDFQWAIKEVNEVLERYIIE